MRQDVILRLRSQATFAQDDDFLVETFGFVFKVHAATHCAHSPIRVVDGFNRPMGAIKIAPTHMDNASG